MSRRVGMTEKKIPVKQSDEDKMLEGFMNPNGEKQSDEDKKSDGKEKK